MKEQQQPKPLRLSLVIPCYNEAGRIELLYKDLQTFINSWTGWLEIIIVNDGSKDNTYDLLHAHPVYRQHSSIITIVSQQNTGKGGALRNGVLKTTGDFILTLDADMATSPMQLIKWLDMLGWELENDTIYIGSREHMNSTINNVEGERKLAGNIFNVIIRSLTPLRARDTQCGFKLYPAAVAKKLFGELKTYGWAHDVELLCLAHLDKVDVVEMPVFWTAIEDSKVRVFRDGFKMLIEVLGIMMSLKRRRRSGVSKGTDNNIELSQHRRA